MSVGSFQYKLTVKGFWLCRTQFIQIWILYLFGGFDGLVPTSAHIHNGAAGKNGPVYTALTPSVLPEFILARLQLAATC